MERRSKRLQKRQTKPRKPWAADDAGMLFAVFPAHYPGQTTVALSATPVLGISAVRGPTLKEML
jgi:hypothetical protein